MASRWDPWRGCHRCSAGCQNCYILRAAERRGESIAAVERTEKFDAPVAKKKNGAYKMQPGLVWLCFASDFLIEDADPWRGACFAMMRERPDLHFHFLTKRIERFMDCVPADWGDGYDNVTVGCTVENQAMCDRKLSVFDRLPIKHKNIVCQPLLEQVHIETHLSGVELVVVGGESGAGSRLFDTDWALSLREQCMLNRVSFSYRQCGSLTRTDGTVSRFNPFQVSGEARKAGLSVSFEPEH